VCSSDLLDQNHFHDQPIDWLIALMAAMNVPLPTTEPDLPVPAATLAAIAERYKSRLRPWTVLGMGGSHPDKDWSEMRWLELLTKLRRRGNGTIFLIGGPQNHARADGLIEHTVGTAAVVNACDLSLIRVVALLRLADLFIGTDSGPMNLAVAAQTDAFALFGATPVLKYSKFIHPIVPEGGPSPGGMKRIAPAAVMEQVAPLLSRLKNPK
jgi:ADP-heptose:LPS heptosyltransferase